MEYVEKSTHVLREEHQLIETAIEAIAEIVKELRQGSGLDRSQIWEMAQSFVIFVGRCHHSKEDFLLFMMRARKGCSVEYSVGSFHAEHHRVELLLAGLQRAANEDLESADGHLAPLVASLQDVVDFYPGHLWKADHVLFPLADDLLSQHDHEVLVEHFAWIEAAVGANAEEQLRAIAAEFHPKPRVA